MKILLLILMFITFSCSEVDSKRWNLCRQERDLLKRNSNTTVNYDFGLTQENQFENLQKQLDFNICNGIYILNAKFPITLEDTIESLVILERICEEDLGQLFKANRLTASLDEPRQYGFFCRQTGTYRRQSLIPCPSPKVRKNVTAVDIIMSVQKRSDGRGQNYFEPGQSRWFC